jgi:hypothetical protein
MRHAIKGPEAFQCFICKHRVGRQDKPSAPWRCTAFPKRIPDVLVQMKRLHNKRYHGDRGIRFEPLEEFVNVSYDEEDVES